MSKRGAFTRGSGALSPKDEASVRLAWETTEETAKAIAARFGVSKNTVIGLANGHKWKPRGARRLPIPKVQPIPRTLFDRCAELDARLKSALDDAKLPDSRMYQARQPPRAP